MDYQVFTGSSSANAIMDGMAFEMNSRLAREQIARQIAYTSAHRRQQQASSRILKPASTGNSPQSLARRRHAAGPRLYSAPVDSMQSIRRRAATSATRRPTSMLSESRPSSWDSNPDNMGIQDQFMGRHSMCELPQQHMNQYQTVAMNGLPTPMTHAELSNMPLDHCFSLDSSPAFQQGYVHMPVSDDWCTAASTTQQIPTPASNFQSTPTNYHLDYLQASHAMYSQIINPTFPCMAAGLSVQTAPPTPETIPFQQPDDDLSTDESVEESEDEDDEGPELVGMGLYDSMPSSSMHDHESIGALNEGSPTGASRMLKLCDAWTPPEDTNSEDGDAEDEDEDEDDEQDNEDEEEEGEEEPAPQGLGDCQQADLPNKSFCFNDADVMRVTSGTGMTSINWGMMTPS